MIQYKDAISGDVILTDAYEISGFFLDFVLKVTGESARNLVEELNLKPRSFSPRDYISFVKQYHTKLAELIARKDPSRAANYRNLAASWIKHVQTDFTAFTFFTGSAFEEGMIILRVDNDDEKPPQFYYLKDGLIAQ